MEVLTPNREAGLTLVETLVAVLILALVAVSILGMFTHSVQLNASGIDYTMLTNVAKNQVEQLIALPFSDAALTAGTTETTTADGVLRIRTVVTDYSINQGTPNLPQALAGGAVAAGVSNTKLITVTVSSQREFLLGSRNATVQRVKAQ